MPSLTLANWLVLLGISSYPRFILARGVSLHTNVSASALPSVAWPVALQLGWTLFFPRLHVAVFSIVACFVRSDKIVLVWTIKWRYCRPLTAQICLVRSHLDCGSLTWSLPCMHASCLHTGYALPCLLVLVLLEWPCSLTCPLLLSWVFLCSVVLSYKLTCWIIRSQFVTYTHRSSSILYRLGSRDPPIGIPL